MSNPRFFIPKPTPTEQPIAAAERFGIYLNDRNEALSWSGTFPLPDIGSRVFITMNNIGWARVVGYFQQDGDKEVFLGVMTKATNPPAYLREQRARDRKKARAGDKNMPQWVLDGIGCEFGAELALKRPKPAKKAA